MSIRSSNLKFLVKSLAVLALSLWGTAVMAQDVKTNVKYRKNTVIDLSGAVIEGELTKPEGSYVVSRKVSRFSNLITARENFHFEILASPDLL